MGASGNHSKRPSFLPTDLTPGTTPPLARRLTGIPVGGGGTSPQRHGHPRRPGTASIRKVCAGRSASQGVPALAGYFRARTPTRQHFSGAGSAREMKACIEQTNGQTVLLRLRMIERTHHPAGVNISPLWRSTMSQAHRGVKFAIAIPLREPLLRRRKSRPPSSRTLGKTPSPKRTCWPIAAHGCPSLNNPKLSCSAMDPYTSTRETQTAGVEGQASDRPTNQYRDRQFKDRA